VSIKAERFVSEASLEQAVQALKACRQIDPEREYDVGSFLDLRLAELRKDLRCAALCCGRRLGILARAAATLHLGPARTAP
jgi:hypothetical protein